MVTVVGTVAVAAQLVQRRVAAQSKAEKAILVPVSTSCVSACGPSVFGKGLTGVDVPVFAVRGSAAAATGVVTRRLRFIANGYTKRGPYRKFRNYHIWQKWTKHMPGLPSQQFRKSREACMHMLKKKYKTRRLFKRERRQLWILRVSSNCKLHGVRYSQFISSLYRRDIIINRKILSQLGIYDRPIFTNVMDLAIPTWREQLDMKMNPPSKEFSPEERDDIIIASIERKYPELYTDPCIRFNRKFTEDGTEYTVDVGDPEEWRKLLPKSPELANFNLPDHFVEDANRQREVHSMFEVLKIRNEDPLDEEYVAAQKEYQKKLEREEAMAERGEPVPPKKEGVSRDDWFKDEPQSWY
jgi:large subunit ribosomal protein L20